MRSRSSFTLLAALSGTGILCMTGNAGQAQTASVANDDPFPHLLAIEKAVDAKRQELHIPGVAFAIVKDGKVLYSRGLGLRNVEKQLPVTSDTLFAIGSSSKAFTAMTVMMAADQGKIALDASPRKYLPYFHLKDPEADQKLTISDLLSHRSGLDRTDLVWTSGRLNSEELIRFLANVKPTAKLGEKFQYQNLMFLTAGQIVGKVEGTPWTSVVERRIFKPLGMNHTDTTIGAMQKADDYALGYAWDAEKKSFTHLPMRDITYCAPAGAINSNLKDMVKWVQFMLDGGVWNGKRLVSEKNFAELSVPRITVAGDMKYGYGWFVRNWNGHKVVEHGGNIDGFNAEVALMPDQHLGFVMLTNVSASALGETAQSAVWENLVKLPMQAEEATGLAPTPEQSVGNYHSGDLNLDFAVAQQNGKLTIHNLAGKNTIPIEPLGNGRYKVGPPAPAGVFVRFRFAKDHPQETEMELEQSGAKISFQRAKAGVDPKSPDIVAQPNNSYNGSLKELVGPYKVQGAPVTFEVAVKNDKVAFVVPGQPPYPLVEKAKDQYSLSNLPADFALLIHRDPAGKITGATLKQPKAMGDVELLFNGGSPAAGLPTAEEIMRKRIEAEGGEAALRRHHSQIFEFRTEIPTQGLSGTMTITAQAPNALTIETDMIVAKKHVFTIRDYFDGEAGGVESSLSPPATKSGTALERSKIAAAYQNLLDWKKLYKSVVVKYMQKVGDEDCYVVEQTPIVGDATTQYISTKSFLLLKKDTTMEVPGVGPLTNSEVFSDYRTVGGIKVPYHIVSSNSLLGDSISTLTRARFDIPIPVSAFQAAPKP